MHFFAVILLLAAGCGKIKKTAMPVVTEEQLARDSDADGVGDLYETDAGRDPLRADVPSGALPASSFVVVRTKEGSQLRHPVKLTSSLRSTLLQHIASERPSQGLSFPAVINYEVDLSSSQEFWKISVNNETPSSLQLLVPKTNVTDLPDLAWEELGTQKVSRPLPVDSTRTIGPQLYSHSNVTAEKHRELMLTNYRLIISTAAGDQAFYLSPQRGFADFLRGLRLKTDATGAIESLLGLSESVDSGVWRYLNLPKKLNTVPEAGTSYALVHSNAQEIMGMRDSLARVMSHVRPGLRAEVGSSTRPRKLVLSFSHPSFAQVVRSSRSYRIGPGNDRTDCETKIRENQGYVLRPFNDYSEALSYLTANGSFPLPSIAGVTVTWWEVGVNGIVVELDVAEGTALQNIETSTLSQEVTWIGVESDSCQGNNRRRTTIFQMDNLHVAAFWNNL